MPAKIRERPILKGEDAKRFLEREKQVDEKHQQLIDKKIQEFNKLFNKPKQYRVVRIYNTLQKEKDFNVDYHLRYIHKIGTQVEHPHQSKVFKDFICLKFENDEADWFHKDDLELT
ncbi:MAG: hypothetical protein LLF98_01795 [Clostridium sp.]|uniref:hypothetical protein n=1 Tax=Clostridium sp. TaxID=1506 RepID=UPI0025C41B04|nr:hypothetical protein [Clostridium sp.]MCE5220013.1 hypothetical protein [Clostridium sp.]